MAAEAASAFCCAASSPLAQGAPEGRPLAGPGASTHMPLKVRAALGEGSQGTQESEACHSLVCCSGLHCSQLEGDSGGQEGAT